MSKLGQRFLKASLVTTLTIAGALLSAVIHAFICVHCMGGRHAFSQIFAVGLIPIFGIDCTIRLFEALIFISGGALLGGLMTFGTMMIDPRKRPGWVILIVLLGVGISAAVSIWFASLDMSCQGFQGSL